jgi:choline dehydrogenase-like flavoprotein
VWRELDRVGVAVWRRVALRKGAAGRLRLRTCVESAPDPESRVTLSRELDALGRRRARVQWKLGELELRSLRRAHRILDEELRRAGAGRLETSLGQDGLWPRSTTGGKHHMGTTRMHSDPVRGVVDRHCRVHGISNLFVAGSSVFPTGGWVNPTLTIVALALRLADRLEDVAASLPQELGSPGSGAGARG